MNYVDLFSGIGGFALGAYWAGMHFENHYFSEVDPYCVELYQKRFPDAIPLGDITKYKEWDIEPGEYIITGGFPCQPFSVAGVRKGKADDRYLWPSMFGVVQKYKPTWIISENVTAIDGMALEDVLSDLGSIGYETAPPLEIPAVAVGAFHERFRVWIIANSSSMGQCGTQSPGEYISDKNRELEGKIQKEIEQHRFGWDVKGGVAAHSNGKDVAGCIEQERSDRQQIGAIFVPESWETWEGVLPESALCRTDDGISNRVDRTKGLGNAIVPQIAELLFRQIKELL